MDFIPLMIPDINDDDISSVLEVLKSGMLVQGKEVEELERHIAGLTGVKCAVAVANGTASLHLALKALGIGPGDEVIVPAFSFIATANVVELAGATPIFVDVDLPSCNINTSCIEQAITKKTKAIIPVHEFGLASDILKIVEIGEAHRLFVIEDAACSLGAHENNRPVGSFGKIGSFSFHPRKSVTSGEGGILTTNDDELAEKIKILRNHGMVSIAGKVEFVEAGYNYRLTDFQAALLKNQLRRLDSILVQKEKIAIRYLNEIKNKNIRLPSVPQGKNHTWQTFHLLLNDSLNRDQVIEILKLKGIGSNYGAQCIPAQRYYFNKYKSDCKKAFPNALSAWKQGLAIPLFQRLTEQQIGFICTSINELL